MLELGQGGSHPNGQFFSADDGMGSTSAPETDRQFEAALSELGIDTFGKCLESEVLPTGKEMVQNAIKGERENAFAYQDSCLHVNGELRQSNDVILVCDIGGTNFRVGVRRAGSRKFESLFKMPVAELNREGSSLGLVKFANAALQETASICGKEDIKLESVKGLGIVWSNEVENYVVVPRPGKAGGIGAKIHGLGTGGSYRKGEFFLQGLTDGYAIQDPFVAAAKQANIELAAFAIQNDTTCTTLAALLDEKYRAKGSILKFPVHAGMVASSGANATITDENGLIHNGEMGGTLTLNPEWLSKGDQLLLQLNGIVKLEDICAGMWLPTVYAGHVKALADKGLPMWKELHEKASELGGIGFTIEDIALLDREQPLDTKKFGPVADLIASQAIQLAQALSVRAGEAAGLMATLSISNLLPVETVFSVALDSRQAHERPGYIKAARRTASKLVGSEKKIRIHLLTPAEGLSVPLEGIGVAVDMQLAQQANGR